MPKPRIMKRHKKPAKKSNVAKIARNIVKKELAKNLEDKYQIKHLDVDGDFVSDIGSTAHSNLPIFIPLEAIRQGLGVSDRIGNELIPKSHRLTGYVYLNQNPETTVYAYSQITTIKFFVGLVRSVSAITTYTALDDVLQPDVLLRDQDGTTTDFLQYGSPTNHGPMQYDLLKMNNYYFKPIKTFSITLGKNSGVLNGNNDPVSGKYPMARKFSIDLTKHLPKKFIYNKQVDSFPENYLPVVYAVAFNACNGALVSNPQLAMKSILKYTDA